MSTPEHAKLTEPLRTVTAVFGGVLLLAVAATVVFTVVGTGSVGGFGNTAVCVTRPGAAYGGGLPSHFGVAARPGTTLSLNGMLQACAAHPTGIQRVLYTLMSLPSALVWAGVLFLLWRVIREAGRDGPFRAHIAVTMRRLGWLIIAGSLAVSAVQGFALDELLNTMLVAQDHFGDLITAPVTGLLPVPVLAGAALLTFARIIRLGADMDDEIKGTV